MGGEEERQHPLLRLLGTWWGATPGGLQLLRGGTGERRRKGQPGEGQSSFLGAQRRRSRLSGYLRWGQRRRSSPASTFTPGLLSFCPHPQFSPWVSQATWSQGCHFEVMQMKSLRYECVCRLVSTCRPRSVRPWECPACVCVCLYFTVQVSPRTYTCGC